MNFNLRGCVTAEECAFPVVVDRIDDDEGTLITIHRDFDGEGPEGEHFFVSLTPDNARKLAAILDQLTK